jgi:hypothetical protein
MKLRIAKKVLCEAINKSPKQRHSRRTVKRAHRRIRASRVVIFFEEGKCRLVRFEHPKGDSPEVQRAMKQAKAILRDR